MSLKRESVLQEMLRKNRLSALVFWRPDELVLTCGYLPLWGLSFLVVTERGATLFVPELEPEDRLPKGVTVRKFPWGVLDCVDPWGALFSMMKGQLLSEEPRQRPVSFIKSIGGTAPCMISGEQPPLPADLADQLSCLTAGGYKDASADMLRLYGSKTEEDVQHIRLAHRAAAVAVGVFYENLRPNISEAELAGLIEYEVQRLTGSDNIHYAKAWPLVMSGKNAMAGGKYARSTGKLMRESEIVLLEMSVCVNGYWADITRSGQTGELSERQKMAFNLVLEAQQLAIERMKPGVAMAGLDRIARKHIEAAGMGALFNHGLGHHVGFRYHDPGHTLSPCSMGILEEGMILTVEPGVYGEEINGGIRIEDNVLITRNGFEILSDYPRGLVNR